MGMAKLRGEFKGDKTRHHSAVNIVCLANTDRTGEFWPKPNPVFQKGVEMKGYVVGGVILIRQMERGRTIETGSFRGRETVVFQAYVSAFGIYMLLLTLLVLFYCEGKSHFSCKIL